MALKIKLQANKRTSFIFCLIFIGFLACILRLGWLQIVQAENLTAKIEQSKNLLQELQSPRGTIYDANGNELAISLISKSLYVDPLAMDDARDADNEKRKPRQLAAQLLSPLLNKPIDDLLGIFNTSNHFVWLERTMDKTRADKIQQIILDNKLNGFGFLNESKRYYPLGTLAAQVLGFVGTDDRGLGGIEMSFDSILKSAIQPQFVETDIFGNPIFSSVLASNKPKKMSSIYLTLDNQIQFATEKALENALARTGAKTASAIVMEVKTGQIVAMANVPTFDPNYFYNYNERTWINSDVSMIYEPGSTFKPLVAAIAINENLIQPQTPVYDYGKIKVGDKEIKNAEGNALGSILFSDVITKSINTNMVELGLIIGKERLNDYAAKFGFGLPLGIDLPGEESGLLFNTKEMLNIDIASMSIGQGIAVTPLQLICAVNVIANNGNFIKPQIVKKIVNPDGSLIQESKVIHKNQLITEETSKKVLHMMENVVLNGGGTLAQIPGYRIAGKTGTAEKLKSGGGYAANEYFASFVGIAPIENPQYIVLVIVDTPHSVYYGSQVAAPIFKEIMQQILVIKGIEPSSSNINLQSAKTKQNTTSQPVSLVSGNQTIVPDLNGYTMRECAKILQQNNLTLVPIGSGKAIKQNPPALSTAPNQSIVTIWFN